jgi:hypothetical protein
MDNRYKSNRAGRCLLLANLGLIAVGLFIAVAFPHLLRFFRHNELVNAPILAVFAVGVLLVYMNLTRLLREERLANLVRRSKRRLGSGATPGPTGTRRRTHPGRPGAGAGPTRGAGP